MISEFVLAAILQYGYVKGTKAIKELKYKEEKKHFLNVCNNEEVVFPVLETAFEEYGTRLVVSLKNKTYKDIEALKDSLETEYGSRIEIEQNNNIKTATIHVLHKRLNDYDFKFEVRNLKPNQLFVGLDNKLKPIIVDMFKKPHVLVTGSTNSGKSQEMKMLLTNLIATSNQVEIYFSNVACTADYKTIIKCKQVKAYVEDFQESFKLFNYIMHIYEKRMGMFNKKDVADIKEWNKKYEDKNMNLIYLVIDEFADYYPANKLDKNYDIKTKCYNVLKEIVRKVRKAGIYMLVGIQRPDTTVLDPSLKSNLTTKIGFTQENDASSLVVCDTTELANIPERECLIISGTIRTWSRSLYFDEIIMIKHLKKSLVSKRTSLDDFNVFLKETSKEDKNKKSIIRNKIVAINEAAATVENNTRVKNIEVITVKSSDYRYENGNLLLNIRRIVEE